GRPGPSKDTENRTLEAATSLGGPPNTPGPDDLHSNSHGSHSDLCPNPEDPSFPQKRRRLSPGADDGFVANGSLWTSSNVAPMHTKDIGRRVGHPQPVSGPDRLGPGPGREGSGARLTRIAYIDLDEPAHPSTPNDPSSRTNGPAHAQVAREILDLGGGSPPDWVVLSGTHAADKATALASSDALREGAYRVVAPTGEKTPPSLAILSRFPLAGRPKLHAGSKDGNPVFEATFRLDGKPLTVFAPASGDRHRACSSSLLESLVHQRRALNPKAEILVVGGPKLLQTEVGIGQAFVQGLLASSDDSPYRQAKLPGSAELLAEAVRRYFGEDRSLGELNPTELEELGQNLLNQIWTRLDSLQQKGPAGKAASDWAAGLANVANASRPGGVATTLELFGAANDEEGGDLVALRSKASKPKRKQVPEDQNAREDGRSAHGVPFPPVRPEQFEGLEGRELLKAIRDAFQVRTLLSYRDAREVLFDLHNEDGAVDCVYADHSVETEGIPDHQGPDGMNTEHTLPRSRGANGEREADLHNLYPTQSTVNSRRSNHPFGEVVDVEWEDPSGAKLGQDADGETVFEPPDEHKGNVARALLYMKAVYGDAVEITEGEESLLTKWHEADPVNSAERARSAAIRQVQGNENPFVVMPELFARAAA
ncbi:MAG TPA: endonuclease, partial [Myxococcales bacterium LLY-WYZ-16_1]|nr:endonuclease [Myxococcales bacterium LLY-WYZ-16_1]